MDFPKAVCWLSRWEKSKVVENVLFFRRLSHTGHVGACTQRDILRHLSHQQLRTHSLSLAASQLLRQLFLSSHDKNSLLQKVPGTCPAGNNPGTVISAFLYYHSDGDTIR